MALNQLQTIQYQLTELENKMLLETKKRQPLLSSIHPLQTPTANNLLHYLTLRKEEIRELQDALHALGLSSLASSESRIHRQLQAMLQLLGKHYTTSQLDTCIYKYNQQQIIHKSEMLFGSKSDDVIPYLMVTFDAGFADNYMLIKTLLQNGMNVARINCAHDDEVAWSKMIQQLRNACRITGLKYKIYMDLAGPKIRTKLMCKGREKGKLKVKEGGLVWLADDAKGFAATDIVICPNEPGIVAMLKKGERVYIDDGMVKGVIETIDKRRAPY